MMWEAFAFAAVGLVLAFAADTLQAERFPSRALVLATGLVAALLGGLVARIVLGPGYFPLNALVALIATAAILSLLVRPAPRQNRSAPHPA